MTYCKRGSPCSIEPYGVILVFTRVMPRAVCINMTWTVRPFDTKPVLTHDQREASRGV